MAEATLKSWKLWVGVLAGLIISGLIAVLLTIRLPGSGQEEESREPAPTSSAKVADRNGEQTSEPQPDEPESSAEGSVCPELSDEQKLYSTKAPKTEWVVSPKPMEAYVPMSKAFGPAKTDGTFYRCFAHSAMGAVFAGWNLFVDFGNGEDDAAFPGDERDELRQQVELSGVGNTSRIVGYRVVSSSGSQAIIDYATSENAGRGTPYVRVSLRWSEEDRDWRLDLSGEGITYGSEPNLDHFAVWE